MSPLVTIAIPTLNGSRYVQETLASVLAQDYENLDILISDNASSDATPTLARAQIGADPRARFRQNSKTVSMHEHFTQCVEAARGEFFILLCDDDRINMSFVSELVSVASRYPDIRVVVPANVVIDERGNVIEECATPEYEVFDGPEFVCQWLHGQGPRFFVDVATLLLRTSTVRQFGGYQNLSGGRNIDNLLFLQCAVGGRVGFARGAVFSWRLDNDSVGNRVTPRQVADSSRDFLVHLRSDPSTASALATLSVARRTAIIEGVRYMTALELVSHISYLGKSAWLQILSNAVPIRRLDKMFWFVVIRLYYRQLRSRLCNLTGVTRSAGEC
jgi:glycosyltransferase involved in cell wall biosynthesis